MNLQRSLFALVLSLSLAPLFAQELDSLNAEARAPFDESRMALHYFRIDWSDAQWENLAGRRVTMIYFIDEVGEPFLEKLQGIDDAAIIDSFQVATGRLPYFMPAYENGQSVTSLYSVQLVFPSFGYSNSLAQWEPHDFEYPEPMTVYELDSAYVKESNMVFMDINVNFLNHLGTVGSYLKPGGGFDLHLGGRWSPRWGAALSFGGELMERNRPFPDDPYPNRGDKTSSGVWIGGLVDRVLTISDRGLLSLRGELGYGQLNAANRLDSGDEEGWVAYRGVHTGVSVNYAIRLSRYMPNFNYDPEVTTAQYYALNLTAGLRYRYYGNDQGRGAFWFIGVGYRMGRDDFRKR